MPRSSKRKMNRAMVRRPRENEIKLLELLNLGPCVLDSGPVGRCSNRGWIRYVALDKSMRGIYALTPAGYAQLEEHWRSMPISAGGRDRNSPRANRVQEP